MLNALLNLAKVPELRDKLLFTAAMFFVFRLGVHIPVPGVDPTAIERMFEQANMLGLLDLFSGGALSKFSVFAMSITPYINASIIMQLLTSAVPTLEEWQKEGGKEGRQRITRITRYLTVVLAFAQACGMAFGFREAILNSGWFSIALIAIILTAGTMFLMWVGDQITRQGIGNGTSLIILAGIVAGLPKGIATIYRYLEAGTINVLNAILFFVIVTVMIVLTVYVHGAFRRIPIAYGKQALSRGRLGFSGERSHIPLKLNQANVIPIIFASSVLMLPATVAQFVNVPWVKTVAHYFAWGTPFQTALYMALIIFFTYFYTAVMINTEELAKNLKNYGGFIPGIRPGKPTEDYLDAVLTRITFIGALFLALIAVLPGIIADMTNIQGVYFGGTALLIVVGVAMDTMKQMEAMIVMRHYRGFMK